MAASYFDTEKPVVFDLTLRQLQMIIDKANEDENFEDIVSFSVLNKRLTVSQKNYPHSEKKVLMDKGCW